MKPPGGFKFHAVRLVMLVLHSSERWPVEGARFLSFVCKSVFYGISVTILQSLFIYIISLQFVNSLLKQISSEGFGSKS
jgi:hypothetical protein